MNWRRFLRRGAADAEQRDELELYVDLTAKEYVARGMDATEATAAARRKLGNATVIREEVYRMNTLTFLESVLHDARHAVRLIRTKPGFSVPALLSLALGIGANVAIFSVVNAVLIRPLPYLEPEALVGVYNSAVLQGEAFRKMPLSLAMYGAYKEQAQAFQEFGVWTAGAATISGTGTPEQIPTVTMTHGVLRALGVRPYLGRWFSKEDETASAQGSVILSYGYWQRRFGGDGHALGRMVLIDFVPRQIIGVMPRNFQFLNAPADILLPERVPGDPIGSNDFDRSGIARLKPGMTLALAAKDVGRVLKIWGAITGMGQFLDQLRFKPDLRPLKQDVVGDIGGVLKILMGALTLVLLLVCANVANLVLVRAQGRRQEVAIRAALGAGWGRISRELLIESITLGILGGAMGLGVAYAVLRLLVTRGSTTLPRLDEISLDSTSVLFALACALGSGVLFWVIAGLKSGRTTTSQNARGATLTTDQMRAQKVLVVAQVGLALVLIIASGLMTRTFLGLRAVRPGFTHPEHIQTIRILIPEAQIPAPEKVVRMQVEIFQRLTAIPGVTAAAFASGLPLEAEYHNGNPVAVEGKSPINQIPPNRTIKQISPGYFAALGTRLIAGRDFSLDDLYNQRRIAILSENMAREYWGDPRDALGKRIRVGTDGPWTEIIGVAENVHEDGVDRKPPAIVYFRAGLQGPVRPGASPGVHRGVTFAIRSNRAGTQGFLREITAVLHAVNPSLPLAKPRTLNDLYRLSMARRSFAFVLLGIAGAMALTLAIVGVYGVLAYAVAQRRRELSIRVALGAEPGIVKALFVRQGLMLACIGGAIGITSAGLLSRWISSLLFGVTPLDPVTYGVSGGIILAAAVTASYIPARRAASLDPMEALRSD